MVSVSKTSWTRGNSLSLAAKSAGRRDRCWSSARALRFLLPKLTSLSMREVCDLPNDAPNFAWCFDCVPEENSLRLGFGAATVEIPSINLVFFHPRELLGDAVHARFGTEFPIRFDFLDTMDGGNLSLQVHPLTEYIQDQFGMNYTQDESYYLLDAKEDAVVYLGVKEGISQKAMITDLKRAQDV